MKKLIFTALASVPFIASAQMYGTYGAGDKHSEDTKSRAEVKAELYDAMENDALAFGEFSLPDVRTQTSGGAGKSRAEVRAELRQAMANDELAFGEFSLPDVSTETSGGTGKSRAEVRAELREAMENDELAFGEFSLPDG